MISEMNSPSGAIKIKEMIGSYGRFHLYSVDFDYDQPIQLAKEQCWITLTDKKGKEIPIDFIPLQESKDIESFLFFIDKLIFHCFYSQKKISWYSATSLKRINKVIDRESTKKEEHFMRYYAEIKSHVDLLEKAKLLIEAVEELTKHE